MTEKTRVNGPRSDLSFYVAFLAEEKKRGGATWAAIAKGWSVTHAHIMTIHSDLGGVGQEFETKLANVLTAGNINELRERASVWRHQNPDWLPDGYAERHGITRPRNDAFRWWAKTVSEFQQDDNRAHLDWAIHAAGTLPQGPEPRPERRLNYVERSVESILDLPEDRQKTYFNEYRRTHRKTRRPKTPPSGSRIGSKPC